MTKLDETRLTGQGQISIPKKVRERMHLQKGARIAFLEDEAGHIYIEEVDQLSDFTSVDWKEFLKKTQKEPVKQFKSKAQFLKYLDKITKSP